MFGKKNEYEMLNKMLDDAIEGKFTEDDFNETELSKLQSKLMRYLNTSSMSEKKLNEEKDSLKELITNISHQTKTPLTNILMYSELLAERTEDGIAREYADEIMAQGRKLNVLIEALVKMSRLETGIFQFEPAEVFLEEIVAAAAEQGRPKAVEKGIDIEFGHPERVSSMIDRKWTVEAVYNILDNAIKYSEEGTTITVSTFAYELFGGIRIEDQEIGMSEDEIPMAFTRFQRGRMVRDKEGIGVGLYLSRQIVEGQGGYIKVNSTSGKGSIFDICFPKIK